MPRTAPPPWVVSSSRSVPWLVDGHRRAPEDVGPVATEHADEPVSLGGLQHDRRADARKRRPDARVEPVDALLDLHRVPAQPSVGAAPEVVLVQPSAEVEIIRGRLSRHVEGKLTGDLVAPRGEK